MARNSALSYESLDSAYLAETRERDRLRKQWDAALLATQEVRWAKEKAERDAELRGWLAEAIAPLMDQGPEAIAAMLVEEFSFDG